MVDLELAYETLKGKLTGYNKLFEYVDGKPPLVYSAKRLQEAFRSLDAYFNQNWLSVIVNAALDRISLTGWKSEQDAITARLEKIYQDNEIQLESFDAHRAALITTEAYIICWVDEDGDLEVYYNDPRMCHMFYRSDNPKKQRMACKWWFDQEGYYNLNLYYPDRIEKYRTTKPNKDGVPPAKYTGFVEVSIDPNPYERIPVFHFRTARHNQTSDIETVVSLQDAVNKLTADMMVAAEYGAFKQRWIISNADTTTLKNAPNEIWNIPPSDSGEQAASVGEFPSTDLGNYLSAISELATSMAVISRTPRHYLFGSGNDTPSGEALVVMESPLVKKVTQYINSFNVVWKELGAFLLSLEGVTVDASELHPQWESVQSVMPLTEAQIMDTGRKSGLAMVTAARWAGKTQEEIDDMEAELDEEKKAGASMAQQLLQQARIRQEQSNDDTMYPQQQPQMERE